MDAVERENLGGFSEPSTDHGSWEFDLATSTTLWSEGVYGIHGVSPSDFEPTMEAVRPLVHPEDQPSYQRVFRNAIASRAPFTVKHRIVRPDATIRTVVVRGAFVPANGAHGDRFVGTTEDVTGRIDYEERLWQLANRDPLQSPPLPGGARARDRCRAPDR